MTPLSIVRRDLAALGLTLKARFEGCSCDACVAMDTNHVTDFLAVSSEDVPFLIAHRHQPEYAFQTITVRQTTDRGTRGVEATKIVGDRSLADFHIQSYAHWLLHIMGWDLRDDLRSMRWQRCPRHRDIVKGAHGQTFIVLCPECSSAQLIEGLD